MCYRFIKHIKVTLLSLLFVVTIDVQDASAFDVTDTIKTAISTHPILKAEQASKNISRHTVKESRAALFPRVSVTAQTGRVSQNNDTTRAQTSDADNAQSYIGEGAISLNQGLYDGSAGKNRYKAAKDRQKASDFDYETNLIEVMRAAIRAHIDVVRARQLVEETQSFLSDVGSYRERMEILVNEGAIGQSELLQADELIILTQNALLGYQEELSIHEASYQEAVGHVPLSTLNVTTQDIDTHIPDTLDKALAFARRDHPSLRSADYMAAAFNKETKAEQGTIKPRVDAELSYSERDQEEPLGGEVENLQALLTMSWDFSFGGAYSARVKRTRAQEDRAHAEKNRRLYIIERDVRQRYAELTASEKQLKILKQRKDANTAIFDSYRGEFEAGTRSILDLINAQNRVYDAKTSHIAGIYKRQLAKYDILGAMGNIHSVLGYSGSSSP